MLNRSYKVDLIRVFPQGVTVNLSLSESNSMVFPDYYVYVSDQRANPKSNLVLPVSVVISCVGQMLPRESTQTRDSPHCSLLLRLIGDAGEGG